MFAHNIADSIHGHSKVGQSSDSTLRTFLRTILRLACPGLYTRVRDAVGRGGRDFRVQRALRKLYSGEVLDGPFSGMKYVERAVGSGWYPKALGCYESELHDIILAVTRSNYETIIDIGCAEGYYAVGLALKCPSAQVIAFDIDQDAQQLCNELSVKNGVDGRIDIRAACDIESLQQVANARHTFVLCDCEGFELQILDPRQVAWLRQADILVEMHDCIIPGLKEELLTRFEGTHHCKIIDSKERDEDKLTILAGLSAADRTHAVRERSVPMQWAWMRSIKNTGR